MKMKEIKRGCISKAKLSNYGTSPRKVRLVADMIRGRNVSNAIDALDMCNKDSAPVLRKLILSAVANATNGDSSIDVESLFVSKIMVDEGRKLMRMMPRARGSASKIIKRSASISLELDEKVSKRA